MKTIIAGSRTILDYELVKQAIKEADFIITEIVSGRAVGPDMLGEKYAMEHNIPIARFPADWNKYGKGAGHIRNKEMANYADQLILVWDGESNGSRSMLGYAQKKGLKIYEKIVDVRFKKVSLFDFI